MQKEMGDHGKSDIGRQFPVHIAVLSSLYRQSRDSRNLCVACRRIVCAHYLPEYQFSIAHQAWKQTSASEWRQAGGQDAVAIMGGAVSSDTGSNDETPALHQGSAF
jgi:hypothetical protein